MSTFLKIIEAVPFILICEIAIFFAARRISYRYEINYIKCRNWAACSTLFIAIFIFAYLWFGGGLDYKNWTDTTQYYANGKAIANDLSSISTLIKNQEWPPHVGYEIFCGLVFTIAGENVFLMCCINAYLCVLSSYILFRISSHLTTEDRSIEIASIYILFPLLVHFSMFLLKDISVLLLVELVVLAFLEIREGRKRKYLVLMLVSMFLLLFYRSFYVLFLVLWIAICLFQGKDRTAWQRLIFSSGIIAVFFGLITILGALNFNIGYTLGGADSFLDFLPQTRVSMNWPSISAVLLLIISHFTEFIKCAFKEILRIFVGPFYWLHRGNFVYLAETERFILFENLTSFYLIGLLTWRITRLRRRTRESAAKNIRCLIWIFVGSLLLVGDVRWRLSLMPYYILLLVDTDDNLNNDSMQT